MNLLISLATLIVIVTVIARILRPGRPASFRGKAWVIDGDTLAFDTRRVRLYGIDAPEMGQSQGPDAKRFLISLVKGQTLTIRPIETDKYGRLVARVFREDGTDVAEMMVGRGFALASSRYTRDYDAAQKIAEANFTGFWRHGGVQNGAAFRAAQ